MMATKLAVLAVLVSCAYAVGIYQQCAGDGYGKFPCDAGLTCFRRNKWYSSCQYSCPRSLGWECEIGLPPLVTPNVALAWAQCGGEGWVGPKACPANYTCYGRARYYAQCRPLNDCPKDWTCAGTPIPTAAPTATATAPASTTPTILSAYAQCNNVGTAICPSGTGCFRSTDSYSECRPSCPNTWACEKDVISIGGQCGGEGYVGVTRCAAGLRCFVRSKYFAMCAATCPSADWSC